MEKKIAAKDVVPGRLAPPPEIVPRNENEKLFLKVSVFQRLCQLPVFRLCMIIIHYYMFLIGAKSGHI